jgi:hypothetical protein
MASRPTTSAMEVAIRKIGKRFHSDTTHLFGILLTGNGDYQRREQEWTHNRLDEADKNGTEHIKVFGGLAHVQSDLKSNHHTQ